MVGRAREAVGRACVPCKWRFACAACARFGDGPDPFRRPLFIRRCNSYLKLRKERITDLYQDFKTGVALCVRMWLWPGP